jgi:hypothetical protein
MRCRCKKYRKKPETSLSFLRDACVLEKELIKEKHQVPHWCTVGFEGKVLVRGNSGGGCLLPLQPAPPALHAVVKPSQSTHQPLT